MCEFSTSKAQGVCAVVTRQAGVTERDQSSRDSRVQQANTGHRAQSASLCLGKSWQQGPCGTGSQRALTGTFQTKEVKSIASDGTLLCCHKGEKKVKVNGNYIFLSSNFNEQPFLTTILQSQAIIPSWCKNLAKKDRSFLVSKSKRVFPVSQ